MVLPCEDNALRAIAQERRYFRVSRFDSLPTDMERELTALLYNEILLLRRLQSYKEDLACRFDYANYSAFRTIDRYNEGSINMNNLRQFFRNNALWISDKEALAVIRRIDTDGDAKISYSEFVDFINVQISDNRMRYSQNNWRSQSQERPRICAEKSSPLRNKKRSHTTEKKKRTTFYSNNTTPNKQKNQGRGLSEERTAEKSFSSGGSPLTKSYR